MFASLFNWRTLLILIAIAIVSGTIVYSQYVAKQIAIKERQQAEAWVEAERTIIRSTDSASIILATKIATENKDIPIIETNTKDSITGNFINLNENALSENPNYLKQQLQLFKQYNPQPIEFILNDSAGTVMRYYYGPSKLLREVKWYPIIQLMIVALFVLIAFFSLQINFKSNQNQLWASMAKETAHQLGTPVSSLEGWLEILKEKQENQSIVSEIEKDIKRLLLVTDRFGKIGSITKLEWGNPYLQTVSVVEYMKKRSSEHILFTINAGDTKQLTTFLSPTLFNWVLENLLKNALDALEGKGSININISRAAKQLTIDIGDTGKGIPSYLFKKVFKPGFTTKKRGWGIGLSLSKKIMEQSHNGKLFVKKSEPGLGTTFSIVLPLLSNQAEV
jgi:signal transduction histidine kinase